MYKKILALTISISILGSLCACGSRVENTDNSNDNQDPLEAVTSENNDLMQNGIDIYNNSGNVTDELEDNENNSTETVVPDIETTVIVEVETDVVDEKANVCETVDVSQADDVKNTNDNIKTSDNMGEYSNGVWGEDDGYAYIVITASGKMLQLDNYAHGNCTIEGNNVYVDSDQLFTANNIKNWSNDIVLFNDDEDDLYIIFNNKLYLVGADGCYNCKTLDTGECFVNYTDDDGYVIEIYFKLTNDKQLFISKALMEEYDETTVYDFEDGEEEDIEKFKLYPELSIVAEALDSYSFQTVN